MGHRQQLQQPLQYRLAFQTTLMRLHDHNVSPVTGLWPHKQDPPQPAEDGITHPRPSTSRIIPPSFIPPNRVDALHSETDQSCQSELPQDLPFEESPRDDLQSPNLCVPQLPTPTDEPETSRRTAQRWSNEANEGQQTASTRRRKRTYPQWTPKPPPQIPLYIYPWPRPAGKRRKLKAWEIRVRQVLSSILRKHGRNLGLRVLPDGYLALPELRGITIETIQSLVDVDPKRSFEMSSEYPTDPSPIWYIRYRRHHIMKNIDVHNLIRIRHPEYIPVAIAGTSFEAWPHIQRDGLRVMTADHGCIELGRRLRGDNFIEGLNKTYDVLIYVDTKKAMSDGIHFYVPRPSWRHTVVLSPGNADRTIPPDCFKYVKWVQKREGAMPGWQDTPEPPSDRELRKKVLKRARKKKRKGDDVALPSYTQFLLQTDVRPGSS
ncbi:hypothetical protein FISHEDRAFT_69442 [Fistulina hepatica ATCC 64428]|uniref:2'-phosphotransferase n=1 Tax=Fistulina hepatica ATCC 64428 TaxID=1128425 RepID=A0A0D7AMK8_9AGAR|nr:hypothetical protein FISHEDRAFT_69442 [Fistulina hepatica ATCC 64428]